MMSRICEARIDAHGRIFYVDHLNKTTSWHRPKLFKQSVENVRKTDKTKRFKLFVTEKPLVPPLNDRMFPNGHPNSRRNGQQSPFYSGQILFLRFSLTMYKLQKAKEIYDNSQSVRHIIHRIRKDSDKFDRFQYNKDLVALLNEFADKTQGMPTDWELKVDVSGREFFIDHKFKRTTFIDPRLPKSFVFQRRHRAKSAPPADSEDRRTDFEQLTYNDKVVRFLRKPGSVEFIFSRLTHQYNQVKLKRKLETISKSGVHALKKYVNDVDLIMALSTCEEEILSDSTYLTEVEKSSSISKFSDFDLKLTDFYLRLGENGFGQGPEKIKLIIRRKHLLTDAFDSIMSLKKRDLQMSKLYINFDDEAGVQNLEKNHYLIYLLS
uniref:WW domain-containing protein n=1 Tax=Romanomermis culicivorax TaxID=13658 RepID=A0A915JXI9_ROMCU